MDTRKHTQHVLAPLASMVEALLEDPSDDARATAFRAAYLGLLERRLQADRGPFDALAERARHGDVYLGCSCPTARQPDVRRCHTVLALQFMAEHYPELEVRLPAATNGAA